MKFEIKGMPAHECVCSGEANSMKELLESAVGSDTDLTFADLSGMDLSFANLSQGQA